MVIIENKEEKLGEGGGGAGQQPATTNTVKLMVKVIASHVCTFYTLLQQGQVYP